LNRQNYRQEKFPVGWPLGEIDLSCRAIPDGWPSGKYFLTVFCSFLTVSGRQEFFLALVVEHQRPKLKEPR
jgi:hypothetical protein